MPTIEIVNKGLVLLCIGFPVLYGVAAYLIMLALPAPRQPFAYLVAGAFAAAVGLIAILAVVIVRSPRRTARKNGLSS